MHINHLSAAETAIQFKLENANHVLKWKRIYYGEGPEDLYQEQRGRSKNMNSKPRKKKLSHNPKQVNKN